MSSHDVLDHDTQDTVSPASDSGKGPPSAGDSPTDRPPSASGGSGSGLVRVTVNLTPRAYEALTRACSQTGDSKTDTINRSLLVYDLIHRLSEEGGGTLTLLGNNGEKEHIHLI